MEVPKEVVNHINSVLAPYGQTYNPNAPAGAPTSGGYMGYHDAAKYLGISIPQLRRLVAGGKIAKIKFGSAKNSKVTFATRTLEEYVSREGRCETSI